MSMNVAKAVIGTFLTAILVNTWLSYVYIMCACADMAGVWLEIDNIMATRVAVVTGSNKGIGFAIVRRLCKEFNGDVVLTSRNEELGREAVKKLEEEGLKPGYCQLDITSSESIENLKKFLVEKYGGLDVLVNNAGIAYKSSTTG